jgi:hypothetical protein
VGLEKKSLVNESDQLMKTFWNSNTLHAAYTWYNLSSDDPRMSATRQANIKKANCELKNVVIWGEFWETDDWFVVQWSPTSVYHTAIKLVEKTERHSTPFQFPMRNYVRYF